MLRESAQVVLPSTGEPVRMRIGLHSGGAVSQQAACHRTPHVPSLGCIQTAMLWRCCMTASAQGRRPEQPSMLFAAILGDAP